MMNDLKIDSFNCQGFKSSIEYVSEVFDEMDFLTLQEHWPNPMEFNLFSSVSEDVLYVARYLQWQKMRFYVRDRLVGYLCFGTGDINMQCFQLIPHLIGWLLLK